ncbi:MAG: hypothetical protein ACETWM_11790 [Candidatus Lokiarchaeia archaeon]
MPDESEEKQPSRNDSKPSFSPKDFEFDISRFRCSHCGSFSVESLRDEPVVSGVFRIFKCKKCGKEFGRFVGRG